MEMGQSYVIKEKVVNNLQLGVGVPKNLSKGVNEVSQLGPGPSSQL